MLAGCLDDNVASEFVSGALPATAVTRVEGHLATCRDCRELVAALVGGDEVHDSNVVTEPRARDHVTSETGGSTRPPMRTWAVGDRVGRYVVLSALGAGGMGVVFAAYDPQLDRKIALKLLRTNTGINSKEARARLRREAQAIAQLNHPNVVNVYDVGTTEDEDVYIAMEFVEGDTLTRWLRNFERSPREIIDVFLQAARGLYAAHAVGLLHRDFKPDNVLVGGDGRVRVTDFGLARSLLGPDEVARPRASATHLHVELTATGTVLGTPRYMPPEQLVGPEIDARSDQFSFCVALYEALYGQHPLPGETAIGMVDRNERAIPPPERKGIPATIGKSVLRGLERDRQKRHMSMAALITELAPRHDRTPVRFAAFGIAAVLVAGVTAATVYASRDPRRPEAPKTDPKMVEALIARVAELEEDRHKLLEELTQTKLASHRDIENLKTQLDQKTEEVNRIVEEVAKLNRKLPVKPAPPPPRRDERVIAALDASVFEGCFKEWSERKAESNADVSISLTVMADGHSHTPVADLPEEVSLKYCVEAAIMRLEFPKGPEELEVRARVRYNAKDEAISLSATVVGRRIPDAPVDLGN